MPKNIKGGSGAKRQKNKPVGKARRLQDIAKSQNPEDCQVYGRVVRAMGNRQMEVSHQLSDNPSAMTTTACRIAGAMCSHGSMYRRIAVGDYVLVQIYDFNAEQGKIIDVYTPDEVYALRRERLWDLTGDVNASADKEDPFYMGESSSDEEDSDLEDDGVVIAAPAAANIDCI